MFGLFQRDLPGVGSVLYRGTMAPRAEEYEYLRKHGFELSPMPVAENAHWGLKLNHAKLGSAELVAIRGFRPPPKELLEFDMGLSGSEKQAAQACGCGVTLRVPGTRKNIPRDRKRLLCFMRAVMSDDGVVGLDHLSQLFWAPEALKDETGHGADVDVSALYSVHAVAMSEDGAQRWVHTHGLDSIGTVDFDLVNPSDDLLGPDLLRAVALGIIEGNLTPGGKPFELLHPNGAVRLVAAAEFDRSAPKDERAVRGDGDPDHVENRVVVCDPSKGLLGRSVRASRRLMAGTDDRTMIHFSTAATDLMADRARKTLNIFKALKEEFAELGLPTIAKIGYPTDSGGEDSREHMWFEVHDVSDEGIDATLASSPFDIAAMKTGDRGLHSVDRLTDWAIMSPAGQINPRDTTPARKIRENYDEIAEIVKQGRE